VFIAANFTTRGNGGYRARARGVTIVLWIDVAKIAPSEGDAMFTGEQLLQMQQRPYGRKVNVTYAKFAEFCIEKDWNVSISFSGGADSSVLLDMFSNHWKLCAEQHGNKPLLVIYANTSNEFASMPKHVHDFCEYEQKKHGITINLHEVKGEQSYLDVVRTVGYPVVSKKVARMVSDVRKYLKETGTKYADILQNIEPYKIESADYLRELGLPHTVVLRLTGVTSENRISKSWSIPKKWMKLIDAPFEVSDKCCDILKKQPLSLVQREANAFPIYATLAEDSQTRREAYLENGCNGKAASTPMGFWLRQDVLRYLNENKIPLAPVYGEIVAHEDGKLEFTGEHNTGCKLCLFGCHLESDPNRIARLKEIEPATYNLAMKPVSEGGFGYKEVMTYCGMTVPT
jgi:3'-phosphoadenosine 5'-phosphosulfate sulfotransferase (PAPS reductase)/FAD synthetase